MTVNSRVAVAGSKLGEAPKTRCDAREGRSGRFAQLLSQRRELVSVPVSGEQLVVEVSAQPAQSRGDCRLAEPEATGGPGDVLLLQEGVKGDQQVQVEVAQRGCTHLRTLEGRSDRPGLCGPICTHAVDRRPR